MQTLEMHNWLRPTGRVHSAGHVNEWKVLPKVHDGRFEARTTFERAKRLTQRESIKKSGELKLIEKSPSADMSWADD